MALGIHKRGQGNWARLIGAGVLVVVGIWAFIETHEWMLNYPYAKYYLPGLILLGFVGCAYYIANRPKVADFLIDTETEMKKVTWPTGREVLGATVVVIVVVIILAGFLFGADRLVIEPIFRLIGILPKAAG